MTQQIKINNALKVKSSAVTKVAMTIFAVLFLSLFASSQTVDENYLRRPSLHKTRQTVSVPAHSPVYTVLVARAFPMIDSAAGELSQMDDADAFDLENLLFGPGKKETPKTATKTTKTKKQSTKKRITRIAPKLIY